MALPSSLKMAIPPPIPAPVAMSPRIFLGSRIDERLNDLENAAPPDLPALLAAAVTLPSKPESSARILKNRSPIDDV
jgi:hypothetical protein